jgi:hypothetical protein
LRGRISSARATRLRGSLLGEMEASSVVGLWQRQGELFTLLGRYYADFLFTLQFVSYNKMLQHVHNSCQSTMVLSLPQSVCPISPIRHGKSRPSLKRSTPQDPRLQAMPEEAPRRAVDVITGLLTRALSDLARYLTYSINSSSTVEPHSYLLYKSLLNSILPRHHYAFLTSRPIQRHNVGSLPPSPRPPSDRGRRPRSLFSNVHPCPPPTTHAYGHSFWYLCHRQAVRDQSKGRRKIFESIGRRNREADKQWEHTRFDMKHGVCELELTWLLKDSSRDWRSALSRSL